MTPPPEQSVDKKRRVPAGSFEPVGGAPVSGPNYALPSVSPVPPPPFAPRIPPPLLFGFLLAVLLGAGGLLLFSSRPETEELTAEKIGALINEQEQTIRDNATAVTESRTGSAVLEIETYPAGANVSLDGQRVGETPILRDRLPSQWYVLSIWKVGHRSVDSLVYLEPGQRTRLSVTLTPFDLAVGEFEGDGELAPRTSTQPERPTGTSPPVQVPPPATASSSPPAPSPVQTGSIQITSSPSGVPITLDGQSVGTTPLNLTDVAAGTHTVELSLAGHETQSFQVDVEPGQRNTVQAALPEVATAPQTGALSIIVHPWGSIYINGTLHARDTDLRYEVTLPVGEHQIRVEHPALGSWERTVEIEPDQSMSLTADLSPR